MVLAIGYDFVEYAPCFWNPRRDKHIVHVDGLPAEVDEHYIVDVGELGDLRLSLPLIQEHLASSSFRLVMGQAGQENGYRWVRG